VKEVRDVRAGGVLLEFHLGLGEGLHIVEQLLQLTQLHLEYGFFVRQKKKKKKKKTGFIFASSSRHERVALAEEGEERPVLALLHSHQGFVAAVELRLEFIPSHPLGIWSCVSCVSCRVLRVVG
jgi:hypothetical protein